MDVNYIPLEERKIFNFPVKELYNSLLKILQPQAEPDFTFTPVIGGEKKHCKNF